MQAKPMDWAEMPYFLAVAREGSLRLAAESLGVSHGTVDRHIHSLEAACKTCLFQRTTQGMVLTTAGEALVPAATKAETLIMGARNTLPSMTASAAGRVRFAMPSWIAYPIIAPRVRKFRALYPDIDLEIMVIDPEAARHGITLAEGSEAQLTDVRSQPLAAAPPSLTIEG